MLDPGVLQHVVEFMDEGCLHDLGLLSCGGRSNSCVRRITWSARVGTVGIRRAGSVGIGTAMNRPCDSRRR